MTEEQKRNQWFVVHVLAGQEQKVHDNLVKRVKTEEMADFIYDVVLHIEHVREVAGIEHVGIGGDFDGTSMLPDGLDDVGGYPRLFDALREQHWSTTEIEQLSSANALRVLRAAEATATA